ncbi:MAG TPA: carboxypeptidase regulatory-like domain-containing protein, partial [Gemmatimonadales bacterium]|nr:carboxypeptidase regulatory-like domain-containing protein [Gemmatimonadales bacterium]
MRCPAGFVILALLPGSISLAQQPDSGAPKAPTAISGTVLAADGTPMPLAHVTIGRSPQLIAVVQADGHGSYRIETDWTGVLTLMFTGVDHERKNVEVMVGEGGGTIGLDVRLRTYPYNDDLSNVMAIGDFNAMSLSDGARPMERQPDGTYLLEVPVAPGADTLAYQLLNTVGQGHSVNGTHSDWLVYDNGGDYRSVIRVTDGVGRIRFDPGKLRRAPDTASVAFRNPESVPARYARFVGAIQDATQNFLAQMARLKLARDSMLAWRQAYDWSDLDRLLDSALAATPDADLRATLRAGYVAHAQHVDTLTARMLLVEVPPESWKWTIGYDLLVQAIYRSGQPEAYTGYALAVLRKNTDRDVRADALTYLLGQAARQKAQDQVDLLYAWLTS